MMRNSDEKLADEAAKWLEKLAESSPEVQAEFMTWLKESPAHVNAMLLAQAREHDFNHVLDGRISRQLRLTSRTPKIEMPPMHALTSLTRWISKPIYEAFIEPLVADVCEDYYKAIASGKHGKAKFIVWRGHWRALKPLLVAIWAVVAAWAKLRGG